MAASMSIHIMSNTPESDEALKCFFSNHLGSTYFDPDYECPESGPQTCNVHFDIMANNGVLEVGEVSWLKAALIGDAETYVPSPVHQVAELLSEPTEITPELVDQLEAAFDLPNTTGYSVADNKDNVRSKLAPYMGKGYRAFTISW